MKNEDNYVGCLVEPVKATHSSFSKDKQISFKNLTFE